MLLETDFFNLSWLYLSAECVRLLIKINRTKTDIKFCMVTISIVTLPNLNLQKKLII